MIVRRHRLRFHRQVWLRAFCMACTVTLFTAATKLTTARKCDCPAIRRQFSSCCSCGPFSSAAGPGRPVRLLFVLAGIVCCFAENLSTGRTTGDIAAVLARMAYAGVYMLNVSPKSDALSSILLGQLLAIPIGIPSLYRKPIMNPTCIVPPHWESYRSALPITSSARGSVPTAGYRFYHLWD